MGSGAFDLVQFNPGWMGDYVDFLEPLDPYMDRWDPAWEDIHEGFRVWENTYQGTRYSLTMDGDILFTYYNSDVYGNADEQAAFKEKYGYDLAPPATWDQVVDIQEFFRRDTDGDGEIDSWGYSDPIHQAGSRLLLVPAALHQLCRAQPAVHGPGDDGAPHQQRGGGPGARELQAHDRSRTSGHAVLGMGRSACRVHAGPGPDSGSLA